MPPPEELEDLNGFSTSRKVLSVRSEIVLKNATPYVLFIVEFLESSKLVPRQPKVDYREKLSEEDFQAFSRLRDLRKTIADREGMPVYAILSNAQLAEMVEKRIRIVQGLLVYCQLGVQKLIFKF